MGILSMGNFLRQLFKRFTTSKRKPSPFLRPPQLTYLEERITPATITVSSNADAGAGTLRQAIIDANASAGDDTINFGITGTITLASSLPAIVTATTAGTLSVTGPGSTLLTISGNNKNLQVFKINSGANLSFSGITISGASTSFRGTVENYGTLSISDSTLSGNSSTSRGGAIFNGQEFQKTPGVLSISNSILSGNSSDRGGAICAYGTVTISNSILSGNTGGGNGTDDGGGAIYFKGTVYTSEILTISNSTISGNKASIGGGINSLGKVVMSNSTISGNSATAGPGGGIRHNFDLTLSFCTISGNSAATEGGGVFNARITSATNCTIAGNSAASGGGFYNNSVQNNVTLINTILGDNNGGDYGFRVGGGGTGPGTNGASTNNLVTQGSFGWATTVTSAQLNLGVLQNNGGPTATQALVTGSAAISNTVLGTPNLDQRGFTRTTADIGAYSYNYTGNDGIVVSQTLDKQVVLTLPATSSLSDLQLSYNSGANTLTITTVASGFTGSTTFVPSGGIAGITTGTSGGNNTVTIDLATQTMFGGISVVSNSGIGATTLTTALDLSSITGGAANQSITLSTIGGASSTSTLAFSNTIKAKGSGSITLSAGSISGSGVLATTSLSVNSATGMTLATQATSFGSIRNFASGTVTISQTGAAVLSSAVIKGNLSLTASGAISQAGGSVVVTGTTVLDAGGAAVTLDSSSNDFGGGVTVNSASTSVSLRDANALTISALSLAANATLTAVAGTILSMPAADISTGTGNIKLQTLGGALSTTGTLTTTSGTIELIAGGSLTIGHGLTTVSGAIGLVGSSSGLVLSAGVTVDAGSGTILLDGNDGAISFAGSLTTTSNAATAVVIQDATTVSLGNITTGATGRVTLGGANTDNLTGAVTQTGIITTGTLAGWVAAGASLTAQNAITTIADLTSCTGTSGSTGSFTINDVDGITINSFTNNGGSSSFTTSGLLKFFSINNDRQDLSLSGVGVSNPNNQGLYAKNITVNGGAGAISLGTNIRQSNSGVLTLNNTGSFDVTAGRVSDFQDDGRLRLGASSIGGNLTLSGLGIQQSGILTVGGNSTFTATVSGNDVDLGSFANDLSGTVTVNSASNIRDFKLYNTNANAGAITNLTNAAATQLRDLTINYTNAAYQISTLRQSTLRNVSVTAGGAITQASGGITPTGTANFTTGGFAITLTDAANNFGGAVSLANTGANDIAIASAGAFALGSAITASGNVTITAAGTITVGNAITAAGQTVALNSTGGSVNGGSLITAGTVNLDAATGIGNTTALNLAAASIAADSTAGKINIANALGTTVTVSSLTTKGTSNPSGDLITFSQSGGGPVTFNGVSSAGSDPGYGAIKLTSASGDITIAGTGVSNAGTTSTISLTTTGSGNIAVNAAVDAQLNDGDVNLTSAGSITGSGKITAKSLSASAATGISVTTAVTTFSSITNSVSGAISISQTGAIAVPATLVTTGKVSITATGNITVGNSINATGRTVELTSTTGSINGASLITANKATLVAATGIGNTTALNLAATFISADSTEGKIDLNSTLGTAVTVSSLTTKSTVDPTGALITFDQSGGGTVTFNNVSTSGSTAGSGWGVINLTNAGGGIIVAGNGVSSGGTTSTISLTTTGSGNITVNAAVDAGLNDGDVNLTSAGSITGSGLLTGAQGSLVANTGINVNGNLALGFSAISSAAGDITVANVYGIAVPNAITTTGNVSLTGQLIVVANSITAGTDKTVTLKANSGGIYTFAGKTITANSVDLDATTGIGQADGDIPGTVPGLNLAAFFVSADTNAGKIIINNTSGAAVSVTSLTTTGSDGITFNQTGLGGIGIDGPVSTGTGTITITSQKGISGTGLITQANAAGVVTLNAGAGVITLTNAGNNFTGSVSLNNSGANNVAITDTNAIDFAASVLGSGTFTVTAVGITQSGAITQASSAGTVTFNAGAGVITLANASNDFTGSVALNSTGATVAITDANDLALASPTLGANTGITAIAGTTLTLPAFNFSTGTGNIDFQSLSGALATNGSLTTSSGTVSLKGSAGVTVGHNITTTSGTVSVTGAGINLASGKTIDAGSSTITLDSNDGAITLAGALTTTNNTSVAIIIKDASTVSLGNITTGATGFVTLGGATTDNLTGAVTQTGVINTGTLIGNTASDVTLLGVNTIANLGAFTSTGSGGFSLNDLGGLAVTGNVTNTFGAVSIVTTVSVLSIGADITATGQLLTLTGVGINQTTGTILAAGLTVNAGAGSIALNQASNNFTGSVSLNNSGANNVAITDANAIDFAASTLGSGSFTVTAVGITQSGAITAAGTSSFDAGAGVIALTDLGNNFTGAVSLSNSGNNNVDITGLNAIDFGLSTLGSGTFTVTAVGITQSGVITQASSAGTVTFNAGAGVITLTNSSNDFTGAVSLNNSGANNVAITDVNAIDFGASALGDGSFTVTAVGITQTGAITVTGTSSFDAGAGVITLTQSNDFTGTVTLKSTGATVAITDANAIDFGASTLGSGSFTVTAVGITQSGAITAAGTTSFNAGAGVITLANAGNNFTGAVSLNNSGANNVAITDVNAIDFAASVLGSGSFTVTAVGITQSGAITQASSAGAATFNAGTGVITLANASNNFTGSVRLNNSGANNVAITDVNAIDFGTSTLGSGSFAVTAVGITQIGAITQASSAGTVTFNAGAGVITLANASNDFTGSVALNNSGANNVAITDVNAIDFGTSTLGSGSFTVTAVGITQSGAITQASSAGAATFNAGAGVITLANASNNFTGSVRLNNSGANNVAITDVNAIDFGTSTLGSGSFAVTAVGITQIGAITQASSAGAVTFNAGAGVITLTQSNDFTGSVSLNNTGANNVAITDTNAIDLDASTLGSGSFEVTAVGITQIGAITQASSAGTVTFNAGAGVITLANASNDFTGSVALNNSGANNVAITDVNAIDFGTSTLGSGSFTVTAVGITQSGAITQASSAGAATFNAGAGVITLTNPSNNFTGSVSLNNTGANNVAITDTNAIDFGASTLGSGTFTVTAVGITQSGAITVAGTSSFNAGTGVITLTQSNDFTGSVTLNSTGATVAIRDLNAIDFAASVLGSGSFTVTAVGITQTGAITAAGATSFNAGAGVITLANAGNNFSGSVALNNSGANNVAITDVNAIDFAASVLGSGTFTVTAVGITQSGAITQASSAGIVTFNAGAGVITLADASNDFIGSVALNSTGATVAITDVNAIDFGTSTLGSGSFTVTAVGITQSGAITQASSAGAVTFNAGAGVITLADASNDFTGTVTLNSTGASVAITDMNGIDFGSSILGSGTFTVNAVGITQSGAITQASSAGTTSFNAGAGVIALTDLGNNFTGSVRLNNSGANNVAITDVNAIDFGTSTLGIGSFTVTAVGITQSGAITQAFSAGTVTFNAGSGVITLANASNNFTGSVALNSTGATVAITDMNAIDFGASVLGSGSFTVTSVGITQSGAITAVGATSFNAGAGVITLANAGNNFSGSVALNNSGANNVAITDANAIDFGSSTLGSGSFSVTAVGITQSGAITVAGTSSFNAGTGDITLTQSNDFAGSVTLNSTGATVAIRDVNAIDFAASVLGSGSFTVTAVGITQSGAITQASSAGIVTFNAGTGVITLTNASNDFTGSVSLNNSGNNNVSVQDNNDLPMGLSNIGSGTLNLNAGSSGSIRLTSNVTSLNGLQNYNSPILLTSNVDINAGTGDINLPNTISGNFSLTPMTSGSGLTTISGANTNTTTNVTTGVVQINNSSPQTTNFVVSGGTLKGTGSIGNLTATGTGIIAPGNSPGQVTTTNLSLSSTNTLQIEIQGVNSSPIAGTDYDQIVIGSGGTVILGSAILNLSSTYTGNAGTVFTIIDNQDPTTAIQGTFAGLSEGAAVSVNGRAYQISYVGGTGNDVTLTILNSPTITSFNPTAGNAGTSVVITGSDFINVSQVSFNGTAQPTYTVNSPTQITTTIPSGATTGTISITTIAGTATSSNSITIDNTAPTLSISASPGSLKANETSTITFTFSEVVTGFSSSIITVTNGTITNPVLSNSTVYTAVFTPTLGIKADGTISVSNNYFDLLGNQGTASTLTPPIAINTVQTPLVTGSASTSQSGSSVVSLINPDTGETIGSAVPFPDFTGEIRVVSGDFNGDGKVDILAAAGPGGGPAVAILDSETGEVMESFFAFDPAFTGGVFIAVRDFNGDGLLDIIAGAGAGGGPEVRIFNGNGLTVIRSFFAYAEDFTGGVSVANIDFNGDGVLDLVTGAGPGGAPHVKVFDGASGNIISQWYAYPISFTGGVFVAAGDIGNDGNIEVVTGAGTGGAPVVAVWDPYTGALLAQFMAYAEDFTGGVRVGVSDGNFDGILDLVTGAGPGGGPEVKGFSFPTLDLLFSFFSGDPTNTGGVFVS